MSCLSHYKRNLSQSKKLATVTLSVSAKYFCLLLGLYAMCSVWGIEIIFLCVFASLLASLEKKKKSNNCF